tara:strand:- start:250 stop:570 length:321 start_codon:yes stop_codon:yes gene_type:complete
MVIRFLLFFSFFGFFGFMIGCAQDSSSMLDEPASYTEANSAKEYVKVYALRVRAGPNMSSETLRYLEFNDAVQPLETAGSWKRIGDAEWVHGSCLSEIQLDKPSIP